jgi:hypothetical protein
LDVYGVIDDRQTEMHTVESLAPELSPFEVEIAIEKLQRYNLQGMNEFQQN